MSKTPLSLSGPFEIVDLPEENRKGVIKIASGQDNWNAAHIKLTKFKDHIISIKFSAEVKRIGAAAI
jgi:hypothetical protein